MELSNNSLIIILSAIIIVSYIYNMVSAQIKVPSVLLLLFTGIILKIIAESFAINFVFPQSSLELIGTFGLILIVLEASLDLKLNKQEMPMIRNAFLAGFFILMISSISIALIINWWLDVSLKKSLITAIPMAVISSAIAIPSVASLSKKIRDFIVYEATFSDILGIMFFNYAIQEGLTNLSTIGNFGVSLLFIIVISLAGSLLLIFLINKISSHVKFFLILSILLLIYEIGKEFHLPSLLIVLVFGLMIGNSQKFIKGKVARFLNPEKLQKDLIPFKTFTEETAFLIRTFFFVLFGYSVNIKELADTNIIIPGIIIVAVSLIIRYIYLRLTVKEAQRITKLFLAPRGLITIVLFYSIPAQYIIPEVGIGIVFFVIMISALGMTISLRMDDKDIEEVPERPENTYQREFEWNKKVESSPVEEGLGEVK